jgi:hypothetical protein
VWLAMVENNVLDKNPYTIWNNKLYQLVESGENENWELRIVDIK